MDRLPGLGRVPLRSAGKLDRPMPLDHFPSTPAYPRWVWKSRDQPGIGSSTSRPSAAIGTSSPQPHDDAGRAFGAGFHAPAMAQYRVGQYEEVLQSQARVEVIHARKKHLLT